MDTIDAKLFLTIDFKKTELSILKILEGSILGNFHITYLEHNSPFTYKFKYQFTKFAENVFVFKVEK